MFFVVAGKWFRREIGSFFVVAGKFYYNRKKKIQSSVWQVRNYYYDRKKKIQLSVWWVRDHYYDRKKKIQLSVWWVRDHVCLSCRDRYICISSALIKPNTNLLVQLQYIRYI
jgi:hypothetical protein